MSGKPDTRKIAVGPSKAAKILGVTRTSVFRYERLGKLKPVSNGMHKPGREGRKYLVSDLELLKASTKRKRKRGQEWTSVKDVNPVVAEAFVLIKRGATWEEVVARTKIDPYYAYELWELAQKGSFEKLQKERAAERQRQKDEIEQKKRDAEAARIARRERYERILRDKRAIVEAEARLVELEREAWRARMGLPSQATNVPTSSASPERQADSHSPRSSE